MLLLSQEGVSKELSAEERERKARIKQLRDEETAAVRSFGETQERIRSETYRLQTEFENTEEEYQLKKTALFQEVQSLEARRADALKPIKEQQQAIELARKAVHEREQELEVKKTLLQRLEQDLTERMERLADRVDAATLLEEELADRSVGVENAEKILKESSKQLSIRWTEYHQAFLEASQAMALREAEVKKQEHANSVFKKTLDNEAEKHKEERRAIRDGYKSLAKARKEILGRDT